MCHFTVHPDGSGAQPTAVSGSCLRSSPSSPLPGAHDSLHSSASYPPFPEHGDCRGKEPSVAAAAAHCTAGCMLEVILPVALSADRKGLSSALRADTGFRLIFSNREAYTLSPVCVSDTTLSATFFSFCTDISIFCKRTARAVLTGMCYSAGSAMRHGSSSLTRLTGQSAMTASTWRR